MIGIIDYGMGNVRSVQKAIEFLGETAVLTADKSVLGGCDKLILPGVGSFGAGMENLKKSGLVPFIKSWKKPLLGICLGMQFLLSESEEEGLNEGLGLIAGRAVRFNEGKIPQIGWNGVFNLKSPLFQGIAEGTEFYFVHSYFADTTDEFTLGTTEYYRNYASVIGRENFYGVQFHPEKSGSAGLKLLENFIRL